MEPSAFVFYLFAFIAVFAALRVVTARNPVHAALFLVLTFLSVAGVWLLLGAEFLALTLALVYVGAVMVLILFVVMMLDIQIDRLRQGFWAHWPVALLVGGLMLLQLGTAVWYQFSAVVQDGALAGPPGVSNTVLLGRLLFTEYVYPVQLAALILLVAMVAAIALTLRRRAGVKQQNPGEQVRVRAQDRLRWVQVPAAPQSTQAGESS